MTSKNGLFLQHATVALNTFYNSIDISDMSRERIHLREMEIRMVYPMTSEQKMMRPHATVRMDLHFLTEIVF